MSSVSTCSHAELLAFPASDTVNYKNLTQGQQDYVVCGGVRQVQSRLAQGINDVRFGAKVTMLAGDGNEVIVSWQSPIHWDGNTFSQRFDRAVLAVSADVAAKLYSPLAKTLGKIPTRRVRCSILSSHLGKYHILRGVDISSTKGCAHHGETSPSEVITFRTQCNEGGPRTEAFHTMPSGVLVNTRPLDTEKEINSKETLEVAKFTRTLRTPESRAIVEQIMGRSGPQEGWINGDGNIWLAGSWCWDGMVLLEGCVVSAMQVARDFGVRIPWE